MRIGEFKNRDLKSTAKEPLKINTGKKIEFSNTLDLCQEKERNTDLKKLLDRIEETGTALAKSRSISDLKKYKNAVSEFLEEANKRTYRLREESSWDFMGNRKHHILVEKIDSRIGELTEELVSKEGDNLKILDILGEIKGLLVDDYM